MTSISVAPFVANSDGYAEKEISGELLTDHLWHSLVVEFDRSKLVETYGVTVWDRETVDISTKLDLLELYVDDVWLE